MICWQSYRVPVRIKFIIFQHLHSSLLCYTGFMKGYRAVRHVLLWKLDGKEHQLLCWRTDAGIYRHVFRLVRSWRLNLHSFEFCREWEGKKVPFNTEVMETSRPNVAHLNTGGNRWTTRLVQSIAIRSLLPQPISATATYCPQVWILMQDQKGIS